MARKRMLSPSWAKHADLYDAEVVSDLPLRVAFAALWTVTDRRGIFAWSRNLKPDVLPYDACDMIAVLDALEAAGFVTKYEVDGKPYGIIPSFKDHQHFHKNELPSTLPAPSEHPASTVLAPEQDAPSTDTLGKSTASDGRLAASGYRHTAIDIRLATEEAVPAASSDVTRLLNGLTDPEARLSWQAEINVARQGMHGPILTDEQIDRACRDYVGNGHLASPTLRHFRAFLKSAGQAPVIRTVVVKGGSGVATADDEAAWADAQKAIEQLSRGQLSADAYNALPANLRAGLRRAGGWTAIRDAKPGDLPWRRKDFLAGYHDSPATVTA